MIVQLPINHFLGCLNNGRGNFGINGPQRAICFRRRLLDLSQSADKLARETEIANREIKHSPLRARAIVCVYGYSHLAHRVAFDASFFGGLLHASSSLSMILRWYYITIHTRYFLY